MSYTSKILEIAEQIKTTAERISSLEKSRADWSSKSGQKTIYIGAHWPLYWSNGLENESLSKVKEEIIRLHDDEIFKRKSELEGLRWKLAQIAKQG